MPCTKQAKQRLYIHCTLDTAKVPVCMECRLDNLSSTLTGDSGALSALFPSQLESWNGILSMSMAEDSLGTRPFAQGVRLGMCLYSHGIQLCVGNLCCPRQTLGVTHSTTKCHIKSPATLKAWRKTIPTSFTITESDWSHQLSSLGTTQV